MQGVQDWALPYGISVSWSKNPVRDARLKLFHVKHRPAPTEKMFHVNHLPTQNSLKITSNNCSTSTLPVTLPSAIAASRNRSAINSSL